MYKVLLLASLAALTLSPVGAGATAVRSAGAYLLAIDHSGSMARPGPSGRPRWEVMQERAIEFLRCVPKGSHVWLAIFPDDRKPRKPDMEVDTRALVLHGDADREALIDHIRSYRMPRDQDTPLYDTLALAFEHARHLSESDPGRHISVLVYTDGTDDISKIPSSAVKRLYQEVSSMNSDFHLFQVPLAGGAETLPFGSVKQPGTPVPVRIYPSEIHLPNPVVEPAPEVEFELAEFASCREGLGAEFMLSIEAAHGSSLELSLLTESLPFRPGRHRVRVRIENAAKLDPEVSYAATLRFDFPASKTHTVMAPDELPLVFAKEIFEVDVWPESGEVLAAGKEITFVAQAPQGAEVVWDFGGGDNATGSDARHVYLTAGGQNVGVSVRRGAVTKEMEISLQVIDVGIEIESPGVLRQGVSEVFRARTRGGIERVEWIVDGSVVAGRGERGERGEELKHAFSASGPHTIQARGVHPQLVVLSDELPVDVGQGWSIVEVERGGWGRPFVFRIDPADDIANVDWNFGDGSNESGASPQRTHTYDRHGGFDLTARIAGTDGAVQTAEFAVEVVPNPPVAVAELRVGGEPVAWAEPGDMVELIDLSEGDVARATWYVNDARLEPGQASWVFETEGEQRIRLEIDGPPTVSGDAVRDTVEIKYMIKRINHGAFIAALVGAAALLAAIWHVFSRNQPRSWRLYPSEDPEHQTFGHPLHRYWSRLRKEARPPLERLFPARQHWKRPDYAGEAMVVRRGAKRSKGGYGGTLSHPRARRFGDLQLERQTIGGEDESYYALLDHRDPDSDCKEMYFRLERRPGIDGTDIAVRVIATLIAAGVVYLAYAAVYLES